MEIEYQKVLRYLGNCGVSVDERSSDLIKDIIEFFLANVVPRNVYRICRCQIDSSTVTLGGITIHSQNLARHLEDCRLAVLLAATLGTEADMLIRRFTMQDMEKAVIAQAVCAVIIEAYCDKIERNIAQRPEFNGLYSTARFSPGYGDFDIVHQKDILNVLQCSRIGLTLTDGYMLIPSKSVTAVIGFSPKKCVERHQMGEKCAKCADLQCKFRETV